MYESQRRAQARYQAKNKEKYSVYTLQYYERHPEAKEKNRERAAGRSRFLTACRELFRIEII